MPRVEDCGKSVAGFEQQAEELLLSHWEQERELTPVVLQEPEALTQLGLVEEHLVRSVLGHVVAVEAAERDAAADRYAQWQVPPKDACSSNCGN